MSESDVKSFLEQELGRGASTSSFYWESEDLEDLLDLIVDAVSRLIARNNAKLVADLRRESEAAFRQASI